MLLPKLVFLKPWFFSKLFLNFSDALWLVIRLKLNTGTEPYEIQLNHMFWNGFLKGKVMTLADIIPLKQEYLASQTITFHNEVYF